MLFRNTKYGLWLICVLIFAGITAHAALAQTVADDVVRLDEVIVEAKMDGTAAAGYKVDYTRNLGPWGDRKILDTPYSIFVISSELIENIDSYNPDQFFKMHPLAYSISGYEVNNVTVINLRGFVNSTSNLINGIRTDNSGLGIYLEEVENIEIVSGLSGFMYGAGNVGGYTNYNLKRPTKEFMNRLTVGNYGGAQLYAHADLGGYVLNDKLGYRLNIMGQKGDTAIDKQELERWLMSAAFDFQATDSLLLQTNISYAEFNLDGRQNQFNTHSEALAETPRAMDGSKLWGPKDTFNEVKSFNAGVGMVWDLSSVFTFRAAYNHKEDERKILTPGLTEFINNYSQVSFRLEALKQKFTTDGAYAYLDSKFDTFGVKHKLAVGANGYYRTLERGVFDTATGLRNTNTTANYVFNVRDHRGMANLYVPDLFADLVKMERSAVTSNINFLIGDDIQINDQWSLLVGVNYSHFNNHNYDGITGKFLDKYDKGAWTPAVSVMYKPLPNITTYVTYMEALEQGTIVGSTYKNAGSLLKPLKSEQYEAGIKAEIGELLLTAAVFQIDKGAQYSDDGTIYGKFVQDGRQVHRGIEVTFQGKLFDDLTLFGGGTYIDAEIRKTRNANLKNKTPRAVPSLLGSLYAEYNIPFVEGLTLTGGVYYTGSAYATDSNSRKLKAYTTADLGARYTTDYFGFDTTFRLSVTNITDKRYWAMGTVGMPRTLSFSATASF